MKLDEDDYKGALSVSIIIVSGIVLKLYYEASADNIIIHSAMIWLGSMFLGDAYYKFIKWRDKKIKGGRLLMPSFYLFNSGNPLCSRI